LFNAHRRRWKDTSLLELGFGRSQARLFADADFIASRSFSTALAFSPRYRVASHMIFKTLIQASLSPATATTVAINSFKVQLVFVSSL
jgi:hypothetical protein